jgi:hypothetical protein
MLGSLPESFSGELHWVKLSDSRISSSQLIFDFIIE